MEALDTDRLEIFVPTHPALLHGHGVTNTVGKPLSWEEIQKPGFETAYDFVWLHFDVNEPETVAWIERQGDIPLEAQRGLLADETRPQTSQFENGVFVNLRGVNLNEGAEAEDMVSIRIWCDARRVVTTRRRLLKSIQDVRLTVRNEGGPANTGQLVALIAQRLTLRVEPYIDIIAEKIDDLEDAILTGASENCRSRLAEVRHDAVLLRRFMAPQRDALNNLAQHQGSLFDTRSQIDLREVAGDVTRMTEDIDAARERAMVLQDQLTDQRAEEMNRNMMVLSVVAAIFLPLGFLTGLFGINVGGMPGVDSTAAFWIVVAVCLAIGGGLLVYFKVKNWL
ncbi:zinc transporter ZntB [Hyphococcus sp.]|uniref:zinc transporter ZntB n=1 Tax=Hyphococcus sp. TaxID=2038636 RepID=UPI003D0E646E